MVIVNCRSVTPAGAGHGCGSFSSFDHSRILSHVNLCLLKTSNHFFVENMLQIWQNCRVTFHLFLKYNIFLLLGNKYDSFALIGY